MFSRAYKTKGVEHLSTYLKVYKIGDIVDIKGNGAFQKGMPHKSYHGKTGRVFNVSKHALGVIVKNNELLKKAAKEAGAEAPHCKRIAKQPLGAHTVTIERLFKRQIRKGWVPKFVARFL